MTTRPSSSSSKNERIEHEGRGRQWNFLRATSHEQTQQRCPSDHTAHRRVKCKIRAAPSRPILPGRDACGLPISHRNPRVSPPPIGRGIARDRAIRVRGLPIHVPYNIAAHVVFAGRQIHEREMALVIRMHRPDVFGIPGIRFLEPLATRVTSPHDLVRVGVHGQQLHDGSPARRGHAVVSHRRSRHGPRSGAPRPGESGFVKRHTPRRRTVTGTKE